LKGGVALKERVGIYDPESNKLEFVDMPYDHIKALTYLKKEERVEVDGKVYLGFRLPSGKYLLRPIVGGGNIGETKGKTMD
jgi:hypothetical protein